MLFADKAALENRTKVKLLAIRERELTLYTNNCRTVGTVSALMAGIAGFAVAFPIGGGCRTYFPFLNFCPPRPKISSTLSTTHVLTLCRVYTILFDIILSVGPIFGPGGLKLRDKDYAALDSEHCQ